MSAIENYNYRKRLYVLLQRIPSDRPIEKLIFRECCLFYQDYYNHKVKSKRVEKAYLVEKAVQNGLLQMVKDKDTGEYKLPSDREIRRAIANLIYSGYPIDTYSGECGVAICDNSKIMQARKAEGEKRAKMLLAKSKGYDRATMFINGQLDFIDFVDAEGK